jgi:hypothetical protein
MFLLARNEEINKWLDEHPAVLGAGAIALGGLLLAFGIRALLTGRSHAKYGIELQGPVAYAHGGVLALIGGGIVLFGLYKLVTGIL